MNYINMILDINILLTSFFLIFINYLILLNRKLIAEKLKIYDYPNNRKIHKTPTPLIGGLCIFVSLIILNFIFYFTNSVEIKNFFILIFIYSLFFFIGLWDDIKNLSPKIRTLLILIVITSLLLLDENYLIEELRFKYSEIIIELNYFSIIFTAFCFFALYNALNFIDGYNGIAITISIYWCSFLFTKNNNLIYFFIFLILFLEILNGSVATSFLYLIAIYLVNIIVTKKINFIFSFSIILVCVLLHTFKYEYRNATWGKAHINASLANVEAAQKENEKSQRSTLDKSKILITTYSNSFLNLKNNKLANSMETFKKRNFKRLTHSFNSLVVVSYLSPQHVPHWNGYSYKIFASKFIPRIFWDGKPSDTLGNGFGKRYKILNNIDRTTSWNMPVLNEFFVNFGSVGVMIGMFLLGSIFTLVPLLLNYRYNNYLFVITFITLYPLFYLESHFSLTFGAVFQTFIFLLVYVYFFKKFLSFMRGFFNF